MGAEFEPPFSCKFFNAFSNFVFALFSNVLKGAGYFSRAFFEIFIEMATCCRLSVSSL